MRRAFDPVDPRALQASVTVCNTDPMTVAARLFGVGRNPICKGVSALEREQGATLFDRDSRPLPLANSARCALLQLASMLDHARIVKISNAGNASVRLGWADSRAAELISSTSLTRGVLAQHIRPALQRLLADTPR
jgi:DNA-binding transcriptional LysR family regulator